MTTDILTFAGVGQASIFLEQAYGLTFKESLSYIWDHAVPSDDPSTVTFSVKHLQEKGYDT